MSNIHGSQLGADYNVGGNNQVQGGGEIPTRTAEEDMVALSLVASKLG
jgi:hypothetical protein